MSWELSLLTAVGGGAIGAIAAMKYCEKSARRAVLALMADGKERAMQTIVQECHNCSATYVMMALLDLLDEGILECRGGIVELEAKNGTGRHFYVTVLYKLKPGKTIRAKKKWKWKLWLPVPSPTAT